MYNICDLNNCLKYKFKCWLTKDPSKTSSVEYIILTNYTVELLEIYISIIKERILYNLLLL